MASAPPSPSRNRDIGGLNVGRYLIPAWLLSLAMHGGLLATLGVVFQTAPRGLFSNGDQNAGLAVRYEEPSSEADFEADDDTIVKDVPVGGTAGAAEGEAAESGDSDLLREIIDAGPPSDPTQSLPKSLPAIGAGTVATASRGSTSTSAASATEGASSRSPKIGNPTARTQVFGIHAEAHKFVYVFDRSGSMGGSGRTALAAAKAELIASLSNLDSRHQFQIIFYNDEVKRFSLPGRPWELVFGDDDTKNLAERFIRSVTANGATEHEQALSLALKLAPDVIFFLTDADQPILTPGQLARILAMNGGRTSIHCIEFGMGPALDRENFLTRLAAQNEGEYRYIDISQITGRAP